MFQTERFIEDCRIALRDTNPQPAIRDLVARTVSEPAQIIEALGVPYRAGSEVIYKADDLTILNLCWGPRMEFYPHDHRMWAVIGIYGGKEQNIFYRRSERGLTQHGTKELQTKDTTILGENVIHAVINPLDQITGAIHVYGGNLRETARSEWDTETFEERPYDMEHNKRTFDEANARLLKGGDW